MDFEAVIGLEVHAELETRSKMFCGCPVVDSTKAQPNSAVCPICSGMPGSLPVINRRAVEYGLRVALALECTILERSIFARKNYFYPDLPKGYQISQYEEPLARNGRLVIRTSTGERSIRIRRVHFEEDTGKLTHIEREGQSYTLIDLNRAGVPLLEIVSEPDMRTPEEVRKYAETLRSLLRYLGVNSGDMQKGVLRIEPNVSVRPAGSQSLGTRTEIKNLNSFRALERSVAFEIERQSELLQRGEPVRQETRGWDDLHDCTVIQRVKEEADDYRYFPEPDLPPLLITRDQQEQVRSMLPELPEAKFRRFQTHFGLQNHVIALLIEEPNVADFFEQTIAEASDVSARTVANWIIGDLFGLLNESNLSLADCKISPTNLAALLTMLSQGQINQPSAKLVLTEMFASGKPPEQIVRQHGLIQVSDETLIEQLVNQVLATHPDQLKAYLAGKTTLSRWFFGQVMRLAEGRANPQLVERVLAEKLTDSGSPQM